MIQIKYTEGVSRIVIPSPLILPVAGWIFGWIYSQMIPQPTLTHVLILFVGGVLMAIGISYKLYPFGSIVVEIGDSE